MISISLFDSFDFMTNIIYKADSFTTSGDAIPDPPNSIDEAIELTQIEDTEPKQFLEDFEDCGIKGSGTRVG